MVSEWEDFPWTEPLLVNAYHQLTHFDADEDIRKTSATYADKQAGLLVVSQFEIAGYGGKSRDVAGYRHGQASARPQPTRETHC
jgi:hypothetical protein